MNVEEKFSSIVIFARRSGWKKINERKGKFMEFITSSGSLMVIRIDEKNDLIIEQKDHVRIEGD